MFCTEWVRRYGIQTIVKRKKKDKVALNIRLQKKKSEFELKYAVNDSME